MLEYSLGPNGCGKTTLMRIIATILKPDSGVVEINGVDCKKSPSQIRSFLGYLPQEFGCFRNITAFECLDYIGKLKGLDNKKDRYDKINNVLQEVNLVEYKNTKVGKFSGGMKRRLGIAQATLGDPQLVMVDEPTAGLDPEERIRFRRLLRNFCKNRLILLSTHIVEDIQATCDGVAVLKKSKLHQFTQLSDLASLAKNKVWELEINEKEYHEMSNKYRIISSNNINNVMRVRLLSDFTPAENALSVEPTIEEGYLTCIRE